jgi:hypothetical protein
MVDHPDLYHTSADGTVMDENDWAYVILLCLCVAVCIGFWTFLFIIVLSR